MKVLVKKVGQKLVEKEIETLTDMQNIVGGYIETIPCENKPIAIVVNEEGKLKQLPINFFYSNLLPIPKRDNDITRQIDDTIVGDVFFVREGEEQFESLTEEDIEYVNSFFKFKVSEQQKQTLLNLQTDDYQKRGGNYPKSNVPDTIEVEESDNKISINCSFKNTTEGDAESWLSRKLDCIGIEDYTIRTDQTGDYQDDWVDAYVRISLD